MGFFGGGGNSGGQSNELVDEQIRRNQADIEQRRKNLYQERLDIIKAQGNQVWTPKR